MQLIVCMTVLTMSAFAADTNSSSLFNAGEVGLALSSGYVVDTSKAFSDHYSANLSVGTFWFPYRNVGVEANVPFYSTDGVSVSEIQAGLLFRLPLSSTIPVFKSISPYVGIGGVYNWHTDSSWAYIGKVGVEYRFNSKWGVFAEGQYRNSQLSNLDKGRTSIQGGLKFVF